MRQIIKSLNFLFMQKAQDQPYVEIAMVGHNLNTAYYMF